MYEHDYDFAHIFSTFEHLLQVRRGHDLNTRPEMYAGRGSPLSGIRRSPSERIPLRGEIDAVKQDNQLEAMSYNQKLVYPYLEKRTHGSTGWRSTLLGLGQLCLEHPTCIADPYIEEAIR